MFTPDPKKPRKKIKRNSVDWRRLVHEMAVDADFHCYFCKRVFLEEYLAPCHIVSVGAGGDDTKENIVMGCKECHDQFDRH